MLKALYDALKPGGELVMNDHSAKPGAGTSAVKTLHRSDEALAKSEINAAGPWGLSPRSKRYPRRPLAFLGSTGRYLRDEVSQAGLTPESSGVMKVAPSRTEAPL
jgi:hypothetical protein